jgi:hypothetical protein
MGLKEPKKRPVFIFDFQKRKLKILVEYKWGEVRA